MPAWLLVVVLAGCGRINFDPPGATGTGDAATIDTSGVCPPVPGCPDSFEGVNAGSTLSSTIDVGNHGINGSCGGNANPEAIWELDPLASGDYTISMLEGGIMYTREGCCGGVELSCEFGGGSSVVHPRQVGQRLYIVVEAIGATATIRIQGP